MRRVWATLLLLLFSFGLIPPALLADPYSRLPECCRRLGKHHCALMLATAEDPSSGPAVKGVDGCPYFPAGSMALGHASTPGLAETYSAHISLAASGFRYFPSAPQYSSRFSSCCRGRAPPAFLA